MPALSTDQQGTARKNASSILRALASVGQVHVATALGVSESTVSRWKDKEIDEMGQFLAVLGMKAVSANYKCYDPKSIDALLTLAKERMAQLETPEQLNWERES